MPDFAPHRRPDYGPSRRTVPHQEAATVTPAVERKTRTDKLIGTRTGVTLKTRG